MEIDSESGDLSDILLRLAADYRGQSASLLFAKSRGTLAAATNNQLDDDLGYITWNGYQGGAWNSLAFIRGNYRGDGSTRL
jgi:hypothetical protein